MTRRAMRGVIVLAALALMAGPAVGASISIIDLLDANPTVTPSTDLIGVTTNLTFEKAVITGILPSAVTVQPGTRSVILTEPASDPFGPRQSDFVTLIIGATAPTFNLTFESDGAAMFASDIAALPSGTPTVLEDGNAQNLSTPLNSGSFTITVQSDVGTAEIPEPASGLLLLTGLILTGAGLSGRKKTES